jgi:hypothetical protein
VVIVLRVLLLWRRLGVLRMVLLVSAVLRHGRRIRMLLLMRMLRMLRMLLMRMPARLAVIRIVVVGHCVFCMILVVAMGWIQRYRQNSMDCMDLPCEIASVLFCSVPIALL